MTLPIGDSCLLVPAASSPCRREGLPLRVDLSSESPRTPLRRFVRTVCARRGLTTRAVGPGSSSGWATEGAGGRRVPRSVGSTLQAPDLLGRRDPRTRSEHRGDPRRRGRRTAGRGHTARSSSACAAGPRSARPSSASSPVTRVDRRRRRPPLRLRAGPGHGRTVGQNRSSHRATTGPGLRRDPGARRVHLGGPPRGTRLGRRTTPLTTARCDQAQPGPVAPTRRTT
jgi:hypothetical protein